MSDAGFLELQQGTEPATPSSGFDRVYVDSADDHLKHKRPDGTVIDLDTGGVAGTVTSVALSAPPEFTVTGSPVTSSGTLTLTKANENPNTVWAGPTTGSPVPPTFRSLVAGDIPNLDFSKINTGIVPIAQGGTNSSTTLNNNRVMQSFAGEIVEANAITANRALQSDANGIPTQSTTTATELGYVSGVTSAIQTQLNGKQATGSYITALTGDVTATGPGSAVATIPAGTITTSKLSTITDGITLDQLGGGSTLEIKTGGITDTQINASANIDLTKLDPLSNHNRALESDNSGFIVESAVTSTELGYVSGVTSSIQTQLNGKQATGNYITALTGDIVATGPGSATATIQPASVTASKLATVTDGITLDQSGAGSTLEVKNLGITNAKIANSTIDLTSKVTNALPIANGGTSQTTAASARGPSGLNIDERTTVNNANYIILSTDRYVAQIGTLSAIRTFTLPAANSVNAGQILWIVDESGTANSTNYVTITPAGADTINNSATSALLRTPYGRTELFSDGTSNWTDTVIGVSRGGTGLSTLPTNGQLLIGDGTTSNYDLSNLTAGAGINITNGAGSITITNSGTGQNQLNPGLIGDGVDGAATISSNTTLTRDMYYSSLTVNSAVTLNPGGYCIFCSGTITVNSTGSISRTANNGTTPTTGAGGAGAALAGTTVGSSGAGAAGGAGSTGNGASGATSGAINGEGGAGGAGGNGGQGNGGATVGGSGGNSGILTIRYFRDVQPMWKYTAVGTFMPTAVGGAGGAAGGGDGTNLGRGGGGGGGGGGAVLIICDTLVNNGTIAMNGGNGGNGGTGATGNVGGGAGGGGGGGGKIMIIANHITTRGTLAVNGGTQGTGSAGAGTGTAGTNGANGAQGYATTYEAFTNTWNTTQ